MCADGPSEPPGLPRLLLSDPSTNGHGDLAEASPLPRQAEAAVVDLLTLMGEDPTREGLRDTPRRVVQALQELTQGHQEDPEAILSRTFADAHDEMVVVEGVEFWSLCEHHLLPFHGTAAVGYIPNGRIVGLSKLARLVHTYAQRLQVQERLTDQIADALEQHLEARGVAVHIDATHTCMAMRGVRTPATTVTRSFRGSLRETGPRREFLQLVEQRKRES